MSKELIKALLKADEDKKGFTIKCNKCGREVILHGSDFDNKKIKIFSSDFDGEILIECACEYSINEGGNLYG